MRAWTLGNPDHYESIVRIPGNAKAPGGYAFRTKGEASQYAIGHAEASIYAPFQIELPGPFVKCTTMSYMEAARARHAWHQGLSAEVEGIITKRIYMLQCGVCEPGGRFIILDCPLLLVQAPFINPDTGEIA